MPAIRVRPDHFSGASKLHTRDVDGLAAMVRGLAIDNARRVCEVAAVGQFVDNSTGTAVTVKQFTFPDFTIPTVAFNATASGGVQQAAWNTSVSRISNAQAVLAETINKARGRVGLPLITFPGSIVTSGTVPAVDLTATTSSGVSAVDFASFVASTTTLKQNHRKLVRAFRQVEAALGLVASTTDKLSVNFTNDFALVAPATVAAAATGASSVAVASGTAILADIANNIATMALYWNETLIGAGLTVLTDNSTGTPAITHIVTTLGTMTPFTTAGVDCAPKAGVDTQLALYANAIASLAARSNKLMSFW